MKLSKGHIWPTGCQLNRSVEDVDYIFKKALFLCQSTVERWREVRGTTIWKAQDILQLKNELVATFGQTMSCTETSQLMTLARLLTVFFWPWVDGLFLLSVRRSTQNWWRLCSPHRETPSSTSGWPTPSTSWRPAARRPPWTASRKWPSSRAWRSLWPMWAACSAWNNHWKPTPPPIIVLKSNQSTPPASSLRTMGRRDGSKPVRNSVSLPAGIHLMPECRTCFRLLGFLFCFVFLPIHVTPGPALPSRLTDLMTMMWLPWRQNCRADGLSLRILPCSLKWRSTGHHGDERWSSS